MGFRGHVGQTEGIGKEGGMGGRQGQVCGKGEEGGRERTEWRKDEKEDRGKE